MTHSYFVVMRDFGRRGYEAIVDPEITWNGVVSRVASGEYSDVVFVHYVGSDNIVEDVTAEITAEAQALMLEAAE